MARLLRRLVEQPRACSYLENELAQLEINLMLDVSPAELEALLERGWRHFGPMYFRPKCASCNECLTLRIDVARFAARKSQRRAAKNAARLRRVIGPPVVDEERLALYRKWHSQREERRGWEPSEVDPERYALDFAFPSPFGREAAFRDPEDGDRLVGLGLFDETPNALSAVYFYWDPDRAPSSLGVANVVTLVEQARAQGMAHVYLGYRVMGCASLAYKTSYRPHELLEGRPAFTEKPTWRPET